MKKAGTINPSQLISRWLPWAAVVLVTLVVFIYRSLDSTWIVTWPAGWQTAYRLALLIFLGTAVFFTTSRLVEYYQEQQRVRLQMGESDQKLAEAYQRIANIFRIRQEFFEATNEKQVIDLLLKHSVELTHATGASFVPLDERGRPLAAIHLGTTPLPMPDAWVEYLASPPVRDRCRVCEKGNHFSSTCPLLQGPFSEVAGLHCLPLKRGDREFGVLNLYLQNAPQITPETNAFLTSIIDETVQALEAVWLRQRELSALQQLQDVRQKADLNSLLSGMVENIYQALGADLTLLVFRDYASGKDPVEAFSPPPVRPDLVSGSIPDLARPIIESAIQSVLASGKPFQQTASAANPGQGALHALVAVPLLPVVDLSPDAGQMSRLVVDSLPPLGVLLAANRRSQGFQPRHVVLLQAAAGQFSLVIQNARQLAELEYKTTMEERSRLAREIHDGLAQTIGFLKLQVAQMQGYLERGDYERLRQGLRSYYQTLSEAYQDARYSIDGLRISPTSGSLEPWLQQMLAEFQENTSPQPMTVGLSCYDIQSNLPSEVQAQLIRIVQEALSNVRKHSQAKNVWVSCTEKNGEIILEIQDDGRGFFVEDVPGPSQHGLRGMRERAELVGAEFQTISLPQQGTTVRISVPIKAGEVTL